MSGVARTDLIAGERRHLGKYQLIRRLATGGMAEIYLARAAAIEGFEKLVVLKRILPQYAENDAFIRMFLAEARLAATLHHPNVVQVYDIGEDDGTYFFAMEYVQGVDLRQLFAASRRAGREVPLQHVLYVVTGLCAGLHYAHEMKDPSGTPLGIVHRDVSPSNVLVTFDGGVKVVDFGIAKAANVSTTAGTLKGKIPYMSPEQCHSQPLDRRSDVFSIGTLLWELTVGRRLFQADNEIALIGVVARSEVTPPRQVRPDYPPQLEEIVLKALARDVEQRWQTAQELQLALEDFAHEARLPLSAARFQPFVREVCADAIAKVEGILATTSAAEPQDDPVPDDGAPEDVTSIYGAAQGTAGTPGPVSPVDPTEPGGGGPNAVATAAPVTSVTPAPAAESPAPSRRTGVLLGGVAALAGLAAVAWTVWPTGQGAPQDGASVPAGDRSEASPRQTAEPEAEAPVASPPTPPEAAESKAVAAEAAQAQAEGSGGEPSEAVPSEASPPAESPETTPPNAAQNTKAKPRGGRRSKPRPASGTSPEPTPNKESKPAWNPKAPPPPGL